MKKRILLTAILIGVVAIALYLISPKEDSGSIGVRYRWRHSGSDIYFTVTNGRRNAILMHKVQVQTLQNGSWRTVDDNRPKMSAVLEKGASRVNFQPLWEAGEKWDIIVPDPDEKPWRVVVIYNTEEKGIKAFISWVQLSWRLRSFKYWGGRTYASPAEAISDEIRK